MIQDKLEGNAPSRRIACNSADHAAPVLFSYSRLWIEHEGQIANKNPRLATASQCRQKHISILSRGHVETHLISKIPLQLAPVFDGSAVGRRAKIRNDSSFYMRG